MGCGSSSSPTAAEPPASSNTTQSPSAVAPMRLIAAAVNGRLLSGNQARPASVPLTQPPTYTHPTALTMVSWQQTLLLYNGIDYCCRMSGPELRNCEIVKLRMVIALDEKLTEIEHRESDTCHCPQNIEEDNTY